MFYTDLAAGQTAKIELRDAKQRPVHLLKPMGAPTLIAKSNRVHVVVR
jgi:hypothetical protein